MPEKLAILGGRPVRKDLLPYGHQTIDNEDINEVIKVLKSDWLTQGPKVDEFEKEVARYCGVKHAVAFSSGTAALHAATFSCGISKNYEAITTPMTFVADANSILYCGGTVKFADIEDNLPLINPDEVVKNINNKTKAVIPVDYSGHPCNIERINEIAKEQDIIVIEDAAHSFGSEYKGKKIGSFADITIFSFHPVKNITTGEGGIVVTNNFDLYEKLLLFRSHGITRNPNNMIKNEGSWYYEMHLLGFNYRITDFQCALGISQIKKIDYFVRKRRKIAQIYDKEFENFEEIKTIIEKQDSKSSYHLYPIQLKLEKLNSNRKSIFDALRSENIGVNVHYIPIHYHPYYQNEFGYKRGDFPNSEKYYETAISLPIFPKMTDKDVSDVVEAVTKVIKHYSKINK